MSFVPPGVICWGIRGFGPGAQAGFGVGGRVRRAFFLPVMAIAFAVPAVAGQNFGAHRYARVRETFRRAALLSSVLMLAAPPGGRSRARAHTDRKSTRLNSSHSQISYAVFCLKKKKKLQTTSKNGPSHPECDRDRSEARAFEGGLHTDTPGAVQTQRHPGRRRRQYHVW